MKKILLVTILPLIAMGSIKEDVASIDERLTDIEISNTQQRINVGMEMHMFAGHISNTNVENTGVNYNQRHFKNNFRLKFSGVLNQNFQAYASLQASYLFNSQVQTRIDSDDDMANPTQGSRPYVRTAYFDWRLNKYTVLSAGRLPTTFGPPEHLKHGRGRLGTYPLVSFNLPLDGLSLTFTTPKFIPSTDLSFRTIYVPGGMSDQQQPHKGEPLSASNPAKLAESHEGITQMVEAVVRPKNKKIFDSLTFIGQYSFLRFGSFKEFTAPAQIVKGQYGITDDRNIYRFSADGPKLADIQIATLYLEAQKILGTKIDAYFSHMRSWNRPVAKINALVINDGNDAAGTGGTDSLEGQSFEVGQFVSEGDSQGTRTLYGTRYNFKNSFIGAEFWKTGSTPIPNDLYSDDFIPLGLLAGEVTHVYYTHMFYNNDLSVRVGVQKIHEDKYFQQFNYAESKQDIRTIYTALFVTY